MTNLNIYLNYDLTTDYNFDNDNNFDYKFNNYQLTINIKNKSYINKLINYYDNNDFDNYFKVLNNYIIKNYNINLYNLYLKYYKEDEMEYGVLDILNNIKK